MGVFTLAALAAAQAAQPASPAGAAPSVSSYDPQSIVRALQDEGFKAELGKDGEGDPRIESAANGSRFFIFFYACKQHRNCEDLQFHSSYDTADGKGPSLEAINQWNLNDRFGQASLDATKDPSVTMSVLFTKGAMSKDAFIEHLDVWIASMGRFEKHIGW